jgi:hypothetical protein
VLQVMEEKLKNLGLKVNHHDENLRFLKSEINAIEEVCVDLASKLSVTQCVRPLSCGSFVPLWLCNSLSEKCFSNCRLTGPC